MIGLPLLNLTVLKDGRVFTSKNELDSRVTFPVRMFSETTKTRRICKDKAELFAFLQQHCRAAFCAITAGELMEWLTDAEPTNRVRQSIHADAVRGMPFPETMIFMG